MELFSTTPLVFYVNGRKVVEKSPDPETTLLQYLRNTLHLTGSKLGCGEGGCGACTVMVSRFQRDSRQILNYTVNACLAPVCAFHGLAVTTVEGIGSLRKGLHPVQERLARFHGSQCGFCTPGFVMSMYTLVRNNPEPCMDDIVKSLEGNLCRCTGYRAILDGFRTFSKPGARECLDRNNIAKTANAVVFIEDNCCSAGGQCCQTKNSSEIMCQETTSQLRPAPQLQDVGSLKPYDPSQDPIFPPELQITEPYDTNIVFKGPRVTWYRPINLSSLLDLKAQHPAAKLVVGNTEVGIEMRLKNMLYPILISCNRVPELNAIRCTEHGVRIGASVSLTDVMATLQREVDKIPEHKNRCFLAITDMLQWFAGKQVRNVACLGGNIMTASPISDLNPLFCAAGVKVTVSSKGRGTRELTLDDTFFISYRKTVVEADEILTSIVIPHTKENEYFLGYKQAHRRDDDIAIVNSGFRIRFVDNSDVVDDVTLAFGGMGPSTVIAKKTQNLIKWRRWDDSLLTDVVDSLTTELILPNDAPGGMVSYRRTLAISFFYKFFLALRNALIHKGIGTNGHGILEQLTCAPLPLKKTVMSSTQVFEQVGTEQKPVDPVGRPLIHQSALKQVTGEAIYIDDMPRTEGELHMCLVVSQRARARILGVDPSPALQLPGVVDYLDHKDTTGQNYYNSEAELEIFATKYVTSEGQIIGAILADTREHALVASRAVRIEYEEETPIISIQDAIREASFFQCNNSICHGDVESAFKQCDGVVEGELQGGGQEHFYMETHSCLVVPKEDDEMEVFLSAQSPSASQRSIARTLGVPANKVVCRVKRLGGGFGGKEFQADIAAVRAAVAARKHGVPVRCCFERQEDMVITGGRNPFFGKYKAGYTKDGRVIALLIDFYLNAGNVLECSGFVMERALHSFDCCYNFPNFLIKGVVCKTNLPSNTAFRGFGSPQAMAVTESILTHVASTLSISQNQIREINMYKQTGRSFCNMPMDECSFRECWDVVMEKVNFEKTQKSVVEYNRSNRWKKRGVSVIPLRWLVGIFESPQENQGGALVHVYIDGSVLLTCGGTEMGQGLHTKMIQVASRVLGIPFERIIIGEASTNTVPNTTATAASHSSDINGFAVKNACEKIRRRLKPVVDDNPNGTWEDWIAKAYLDKISLSATGYYGGICLDYDKKTNTGRAFPYYTCGAAYSEVEIDCLTGDHQVRKTEIVMDIGKSLNPAIDIGQIEGAFLQGYGYVALEQCKVTPKGHVLTTGPGTYKIPSVGNFPAELNVTLLKGGEFEKAVYSARGLGEPPLGLALSVFFAIKDAIMAARADNDLHHDFRLDLPATPERIRMACSDIFTKKTQEFDNQTNDRTKLPWFITP